MPNVKIEKYTEKLTEVEMKITKYGENAFGYVYVQGENAPNSDINRALKRAGGKPKDCELLNFSIHGSGKAKPEYIITLKHDLNTIIVVECKNMVKKHCSEDLSHPRDYAVDGALYYAKYLKDSFNVIAIGISGTKKSELRVDAFYWAKNQTSYNELTKSKNIILEPENYLKLVRGEKVQKAYSLSEVKATAVEIHDSLRINKMTEKLKPLFIAGVLIALQDSSFCNDYDKITSFDTLLESCCSAIERVLNDGEIGNEKISEIKEKFREIRTVIKLKATPLSDDNSLRWYINQLEMKIRPMMDYVGNTIDALGIFYHEFISYSSGDGNSLGIVLTPQHLTEFMAELINIDKNSRVVDICCGSGAFLVTAMGKMFKQAVTPEEIEYIRKNTLFGIEQDSDIHTLALANMIMRKDGKSHIIHGDCFDENTIIRLKNLRDVNGENIVLNKGLLNPPYSQKDHVELEFLEQELSLLCQGGEVAIVCPMSCAIGTKFKDIRKRLMERHTLKAVFSMPDDIFYGQGVGTCVCVMVWEAGKPHDPSISTFFGYYKDDGFVKRKKLGRIDAYGRWNEIKAKWLHLYREKKAIDGLTAKACVNEKAEWLCEAYMKTDYTQLTTSVFEQSIRDYLAYRIKNGATGLMQKYSGSPAVAIKDPSQWKEIQLVRLFKVFTSKDPNLQNSNPGDTPYISSSSDNNGLTAYVDTPASQPANTLTIARNGSVGSTFYQPVPYAASPDDIRILVPQKGVQLNVYSGLFIKTVIEQEKFKYAYGRKLGTKRIEKLFIKLPVTDDGEPDFGYMEDYIKSLPYSDRI